MEYLFTQSIVQFAPLRTFARVRMFAPIDARDLFPKARFAPGEYAQVDLFELAWSFLSEPNRGNNSKTWILSGKLHRIGDLPAEIGLSYAAWIRNGKEHRIIRDRKNNLILPAVVGSKLLEWCQNGDIHRDDKDPRTGHTLPAALYKFEFRWYFKWYRSGYEYRNQELPTATRSFSQYE